MLKGLKEICLQSEEKLYLANSKDIIALIKEENLAHLYPSFISDIAFNAPEQKIKHNDPT